MSEIHLYAAHVATFDDAVVTVRHMLHECWILSRQMPRLARRGTIENDVHAEIESAAEDLEQILQDHAEPALAALRQAGEGLVSKDDADEVEHRWVESGLRFAHLAAE